ncbi:hypothetical protein QQ045_032309 [Rhodiola kirilowii]
MLMQNVMVFRTYAILTRVSSKDPPSCTSIFMAGTGTVLLQSFLIEIRLQLQNKAFSADNKKGPMNLAKSIIKTEGLRGIFHGLLVIVLRDSPSYGVYFWSYEWSRELLHPGCQMPGEEGMHTMLVAGGVARVSSWICCYPLDVLKTRLQAQLRCSETKYGGIVDCFYKSVCR